MNATSDTVAYPTSNAIMWQLVRKDWRMVAWPMAGYISLGLLAALLLSVPRHGAFVVGSILLISITIVIGVHMIFGTVTSERSKQTLPMILSLPVTYLQYSVAKLASTLGMFLMGWSALLICTVVVIATRDNLPDGLIPFTVILLTEMFAAYVLTLSVSMVFESEIPTIVVMTMLNIGVSVFINLVGAIPAIGSHMEGPVAVWNNTALTILGIELLIIVAAIAVTLVVQSRKTDFI